jgi:hypothetical protein
MAGDGLHKLTDEQLDLFSSPAHSVSEADKINDKWEEFVITPALMMGRKILSLQSYLLTPT